MIAVLSIIVLIFDRISTNTSLSIISSLQDRNIAIERAKLMGESSYSFTTNFIPGIGAPPAPSENSNQFKVIEESQ